ncbi:unnamed protein product [Bathycoccus prasinos]
MLKYCFSNGCPCDEEQVCKEASAGGHLDLKPSRETENEVAIQATGNGRLEIVKYFVEERNITDAVKILLVAAAAWHGQLDCLKYLLEEAKVPLDLWGYIAHARYYEHPDCVNYLLEKGCPEPTDEQYAGFVEYERSKSGQQSGD